MQYITALINRLTAIDANTFFAKYVPILIGIGVVMLLATFLGPLGILVMLLAIVAEIYFLLKGLQ